MRNENKKDNFTAKNLLHRLKSKTSPFWIKIRNGMIVIGAICGALIGAPAELPSLIDTLAGYGVAIGAVGAVLAQLTKK